MASGGCIVITGAAGALGSAVARRLVKDGWAVALLDSPAHVERGRALASELGQRAVAIGVDVAQQGAIEAALKDLPSSLGDVVGAALIAGGWQGGKPLHEEESATWSAMTHTNQETAHASLRALLPGMVDRKRGSVVVVGSRAIERPWTSAGASAYGATKAAVVALAQAAAAEVLDRGVRINAILPSTLDTPANRRAMPDADPAKWVSLDSCAGVIAFLLSDDARDVSGVALPVYGRA
jgi:NAD(P)-dependent dehydrogenase (short-subunit alcohol dehydrogenase family)